MNPDYKIAIVGAGVAGIGMGLRLRDGGETSFVILEKAGRIGGTWRDNSYPGASCDVRSHLYWYSFDQPDWSRVYSSQAEILTMLEDLVERRDLATHLRFHADLACARWEGGMWHLYLHDGRALTAAILVTAWGQLNQPSYGGIEGVEQFGGDWFHSARWNHAVKIWGRQVASIGNGPSAAQYIPQVAQSAKHLAVFQRTPNYVVPRNDREYTRDERRTFADDRSIFLESREAIYAEHESWFGAMRQGTEVVAGFTAIARQHLESVVTDPPLREKLWPTYPLGCKRIIFSDDYYPALTRANVSVVTEAIRQIEPRGIRTTDGVLHPCDVIIYGTGFETLSFMRTGDIVGRQGMSLRKTWQRGVEAYLGMTVPQFPNLFMLYGPNTSLGHNSIIAMLEAQFSYVLQCLRTLNASKGRALEVKASAIESFGRRLQDDLKGSSWSAGCQSWYKSSDGRVLANWSGSVEDYKARTETVDFGHYELIEAS